MIILFQELFKKFFLPIFIGYFIGYFFNNLSKKISKPLINFGIPILISASLIGNNINKQMFLPLILGFCFIIFQFLFFYYVKNKNNNSDPNFFISPVLGNTGYIGLPISFLFLSNESFIYAIAYDIGSMLATWGLIPLIIKKEKYNQFNLGINSIIKFIFNIPAIRGLLLFSFLGKFSDYSDLEIFLQIISKYISFFALIYVGIFIGELSNKYSYNFIYKELNMFSIIYKLLLSPLLIFLICIMLNINTEVYKSSILQAAMPTGISALLLSEAYNLKIKKVASTIIITTMLSIFTLPLIIFNLK